MFEEQKHYVYIGNTTNKHDIVYNKEKRVVTTQRLTKYYYYCN